MTTKCCQPHRLLSSFVLATLLSVSVVLSSQQSVHDIGSAGHASRGILQATSTSSSSSTAYAPGPSGSSYLTFAVPAYRPQNYSVIVNQRFLVAIDRSQGGATSVAQPFALSLNSNFQKNSFDNFAGAGCVSMNLTSNSSNAQTAVVALLSAADQANAPDQDLELPWSHCKGPSCSITVPTYANNTFIVGVENNASAPETYNFTLSYTLRPNGSAECSQALAALPASQQDSFYLKSHPYAEVTDKPTLVLYNTVAPSSATVIGSFVNTSCLYMGGFLQSNDSGVQLVLLQQSTLGPWFKSNPSAPTFSNAVCGIGANGNCTDNTYGQFKLDPAVTYYLVVQNTCASPQNTAVYLNGRDAAPCSADGSKPTTYSDSVGQGSVLSPEAQQQMDRNGAAAVCLNAGLTATCTAVAGM